MTKELKDILDYTRKARLMGFSDIEIKKHLQDAGWSEKDINKARTILHSIKPTSPELIVPKKRLARGKKKALLLIGSAVLLLIIVLGWIYARLERGGLVNTTILTNRPKQLMEIFFRNGFAAEPISADLNITLSEENLPDYEPLRLSAEAYGGAGEDSEPNGTFLVSAPHRNDEQETSVELRLTGNLLYSHVDQGAALDAESWQTHDAAYGQRLFSVLLPKRDGLLDLLRRQRSTTATFIGWKTVAGKRAAGFLLNVEQTDLILALRQIFASNRTVQTATTNLEELADKLQIKQLTIWLDRDTTQLTGMDLVSNAPSLALLSSIINDGGDAQADDKRLGDIRNLSNALELHFHDRDGYPAAENGSPVGLLPQYLETLPIAPRPTGICGDYYNTYWYEPLGRARRINDLEVYPDYRLTFCLGTDIGGYAAGIGALSPSGISTTQTCPQERPDCFATQTGFAKVFADLLKSSFSGELSLSITYRDFGQSKIVEIPGQNE